MFKLQKILKSFQAIEALERLAVYGGRAFEPQIESLNAGIEIVVGTPGRLLDLYRQGQLKLKEVSRLVLDEADEMLDLGILARCRKNIYEYSKAESNNAFLRDDAW